MNVRFFGGRKSEYVDIPKHNPIGLYFCADSRELFLGDKLLSDGMRVVPTFADLPSISEHKAAEGIIYFVEETRNGYVLPSGRAEWLQVISAPSAIGAAGVDLSGYYTKAEVDEEILEAIANIKIEVDLSGYATKDYVDEKIAAIELPSVPTKMSELENDTGFITEHQDISHLATKSEVDAAINNLSTTIEHIEQNYVTNNYIVENYTTTEQLDAKVTEVVTQEVSTAVTEKIETKVTEIIQEKADAGELDIKVSSISYGTF